MSGIRKRSKRNSSHGMAMPNIDSELAATFRHRKEKNVQLHDEADLVNFRADNVRRFAQNHELLQNVASKLIHTAKIKPPRLFPESGEQYAGKSDEELEQVVQSAISSDLLIFSNIRLMQAKSRLLEADIRAETGRSIESVLSAESKFQKEACETLARLQSEHLLDGSNEGGLQRMEEALAQIEAQLRSQHGKSVQSSHAKYTKTAVEARELDPKVEVLQAPAGYSARESGRKAAEKGAMQQMPELNDGLGFQENMGKGYGDGGLDKAAGVYRENAGGEFGGFDEMMKPAEKGRDELANLGVNMDDLDQFLAGPGPQNNDMDDMDALMNFDQMDGEHANADGMDDAFGVDFLNHMD